MSDYQISLDKEGLCGIPDCGFGPRDRLSGEAMLEAAVSILALAVLRRKAGKALKKSSKPISEESSPGGKEGLDSSPKQSIHS
ncbi:MAG: hypothetical protein HZB23_00875 [Deltaproteobacteria bacterium]|jgi:hypothetical protein|nr:hypothetical protein [Deltaproteobacteria bacterium]